MLAALWSWLLGIFTKKKIGILFMLLFKSGVSAIAAEIANTDLQRKALEFVKELAARNDIGNAEKAQLFNKKLAEYGRKMGKVLRDSVLNCLRELAVAALKAKSGR